MRKNEYLETLFIFSRMAQHLGDMYRGTSTQVSLEVKQHTMKVIDDLLLELGEKPYGRKKKSKKDVVPF